MKAAALIEPLPVSHHCITESGFQKDQTVLVCGTGPIGVALFSILRVISASKIIVTKILEGRLAQAKEFGADVIINPLHTAANVGIGRLLNKRWLPSESSPETGSMSPLTPQVYSRAWI